MRLHEEIFIQFNYQEASTKRCLYRGHLEIAASASVHRHLHLKNLFFPSEFFLKK